VQGQSRTIGRFARVARSDKITLKIQFFSSLLEMMSGFALDVKLVSYRTPSRAILQMADDFC
jgi:hypothetical protein